MTSATGCCSASIAGVIPVWSMSNWVTSARSSGRMSDSHDAVRSIRSSVIRRAWTATSIGT
jgi:hypothetical protein